MKFFSKIFKNKQVVTIASLILCFVILIVAYKYRVDNAIHAISVPIATRDLAPREKIDETCFETKKVAQAMLSANVITNKNQLLGNGDDVPAKYVNYNTFIPEGSLFYTSAVTTWDQMPDSAWADIPDGYTVFSLDHSDQDQTVLSYFDSIFPGTVIDLWYYGSNGGESFYGPLIEGIKVLAVKDEQGNHIFKRSASQKVASALIFQVTNETFLYLTAAKGIPGGKIIAVPRNIEYNPDGMKVIDSGHIRSFINNNSKILQEEASNTNGAVKTTITD